MPENTPGHLAHVQVWEPERATEMVDALLAEQQAGAASARFYVDTAYGPWKDKRFPVGGRKTTAGNNFGVLRLVENSATVTAAVGTYLKWRREILSGRSLDVARREATLEQVPHLVDIYVIIWRLDLLLNADEINVPQWRHDLMSKARRRLLTHLRTIVDAGDLGVHLILVGNGIPQKLSAQWSPSSDA